MWRLSKEVSVFTGIAAARIPRDSIPIALLARGFHQAPHIGAEASATLAPVDFLQRGGGEVVGADGIVREGGEAKEFTVGPGCPARSRVMSPRAACRRSGECSSLWRARS
jgi:hypothetical protein